MRHSIHRAGLAVAALLTFAASGAQAGLLYTPTEFTGLGGVGFPAASNTSSNGLYSFQVRNVSLADPTQGGLVFDFKHTFEVVNGVATDLTPGRTEDTVGKFINNSGQIVGNYDVAARLDLTGFGFAFTPTTPGSAAGSIDVFGGPDFDVVGFNDLGQALGMNRAGALVYDVNTRETTILNNALSDPSFLITSVDAINNVGDIRATGFHGGTPTTILLTPLVDVAAVPEPATLAAAALGALSLGVHVRRKSSRGRGAVPRAS